MVANPVLVEMLRGDAVESRHRGAIAVCDGDGKSVLTMGDTQRPVFPRSAVKAIQALPLVESGAADALGFGDEELALACASHSGEAAHVALADSMLRRAGISASALECGPHWPTGEGAARELARQGAAPGAIHNNCSGKHTGFLCVCAHRSLALRRYSEPDHPFQQSLRAVMEEVTGAAHGEATRGIDGCSIPTYAIPLDALALGFARMCSGVGLGRERAAAARRLMKACMAAPFFVAGTGRADTRLMEAGNARVFVKTGAEGVYCAALPELGLGIALKCDDGAGRAAEIMVAAVLARLVADSDPALAERLDELARPPVRDWNGQMVGGQRPCGGLA